MSNSPNQEVMVFWSYDLPPYLSAGKATIDSMGNAKVPSYQMTLKREHILAVRTMEDGERIRQMLDDAKNEHSKRVRELNKELAKNVMSHLPETNEYFKKSGLLK